MADLEELASKVAMLQAQLDSLSAEMAAISDDIPEQGGNAFFYGEGSSVWSGRVMSNNGVLIAEWDVSDPDNITGEYIRYDGVAGDAAFTDEPDEIYLCWHVADKAEAPATGYTLSTDTSGDIVLPVPKEWAELNVLLTDEDGIQQLKELKIKTEDPDVGLVFAKPETQEDPDEPTLLQLKTTGGKAGDVYVCGEDGAASWATPSIALKQVGADGLKVVLTLGETDYESAVLYGDTCSDD